MIFGEFCNQNIVPSISWNDQTKPQKTLNLVQPPFQSVKFPAYKVMIRWYSCLFVFLWYVECFHYFNNCGYGKNQVAVFDLSFFEISCFNGSVEDTRIMASIWQEKPGIVLNYRCFINVSFKSHFSYLASSLSCILFFWATNFEITIFPAALLSKLHL